jgi:hypothetical protein
MKFKCPACQKIINRDMRDTCNKNRLTKRGYLKSYCSAKQVNVFLRPLAEAK